MWIEKYKTKDITKQLERFEEKLGTKLPEQYRNFLLKYNGGELWGAEFDLAGISSGIRYFYGFVKADEYHSINNKYVKLTQTDFLTKKSVIAIAESGLGDVIAIGINDLDGKVFFCDHDKGYQLTQIADDFKTFVEKVDAKKVCKEELEHPEDKIKSIYAEEGKNPSDAIIEIFWQQYYEQLNAVQEEVVID